MEIAPFSVAPSAKVLADGTLAVITGRPKLYLLLDFTGTEGEFEVSDEDINIGISLKKGNTELKEKLDSVLSTMTEEDFTELMDQAISVQPLSK